MKIIIKGFYSIDKFISWIEVFLLCITLTFLFAVGFYQVVCREIFGQGAVWPEHLLRYSVLIVGFLGAGLACRENRNIRIDLIQHFVGTRNPGPWWRIVEGCLYLIGAVISVFLVKACWEYIKVEQMLAMPIPNTPIPAYAVFYVPMVFFAISAFRYLFYSMFKFTGHALQTTFENEDAACADSVLHSE